MDTETKIKIAKEKKDAADQAFKTGDVKEALKFYHEALMYLNGITRNMSQAMTGSDDKDDKPKTEWDEILEKIYANQSACHMKLGNWKRTVETADKALAKNDKNSKALFRKAKGLGEQGHFEKAEKILTDLLKEDGPDTPAIQAELARLRAADKEREKKHAQKFKGFLNRSKGNNADTELPQSKIEEITSES